MKQSRLAQKQRKMRQEAEVRRRQKEAEEKKLTEDRQDALASIKTALQISDGIGALILLKKNAPLLDPDTAIALRRKAEALLLRDPVTGMEFVKVPGGSFEMGCHAKSGECNNDEWPVRTVRLDGFWIGKHEVTQGQWKRIMGFNPSSFKKGDNYPVESMSWNDVQEFIRGLNNKSSAKFRLPSEAEWEYACRSGGKAVTFGTRSGGMNKSSGKYGGGGTVPVGRYQANSRGLHDMSGNGREWGQDKFTAHRNVATESHR